MVANPPNGGKMILELKLLQELVDRLIDLMRHREEKTKNLYDRVIEPIYRDLLVVHQNYMDMFDETLRLLPVSEDRDARRRHKKFQSALSYLETNRLKLEPIRQKLHILVRELDRSREKNKKDQFIEAVVKYISWAMNESRGTASMGMVRQIQLALAQNSRDPLTAEDVRSYVSRVIIGKRERFVQATEAYGKILAKITK
jgi:hypothetical protein